MYGAHVLQRLLGDTDIDVVGIVRSTRVLQPDYGWWRGAVAQLGRSGPAYTLYLGCAAMLPDLVGSWTRVPSIAVSARRHKIPLLATRDLNDAVGCRFISDRRPDLLLSAFFNQRIGEAVCAIPTAGAVNIHPSLLPDFRGVDPVFHTRLQGSPRFGVTVHRITAEFDTGPVLVQDEVAIDSQKSLLAATWMLFEQGAACLLAQLPAILHGAAGEAQRAGGSYDSWPTSQQVAAFKRGGARLVRFADWRLFFGPEGSR